MSKEYVLWCYLLEFSSQLFFTTAYSAVLFLVLMSLIREFLFLFENQRWKTCQPHFSLSYKMRKHYMARHYFFSFSFFWFALLISLQRFFFFISSLFSLACHDVFGWYILLYTHDKSVSIFKNIVQDLLVLMFIFRCSIYAFGQCFWCTRLGTYWTAITIIVTQKRESEENSPSKYYHVVFCFGSFTTYQTLTMWMNVFVYGVCLILKLQLNTHQSFEHKHRLPLQTTTRVHTRWEDEKRHQQQQTTMAKNGSQ